MPSLKPELSNNKRLMKVRIVNRLSNKFRSLEKLGEKATAAESKYVRVINVAFFKVLIFDGAYNGKTSSEHPFEK